MTSTALELPPEIVALQKECERLRDELVVLATERDFLWHTVKPNLEAKYLVEVGQNEYARFRLEVEVRRLRRKIEILQAALNHGIRLPLGDVEWRLDQEFQEWQAKIKTLLDQIERAKEWQAAPTLTPQAKQELRKLYRTLVKQLHPDANPNQTPQSVALWARVAVAYQRGDLEEMQALALLLDLNLILPAPTRLEELEQHRAELKQSVHRWLDQLARLKNEFPFSLEKEIGDPAWLESRCAEIQAQIEALIEQRTTLTQLAFKLESSTDD